jgi:putative ABC transport system permease protein
MSIFRLLLREIQHRKLNFLLGLLSVVAAVSLVVAVLTASEASQRETVRLMRDMGFNILVVPRSVDMADFWSDGFAKADMPEDYVDKLAKSKRVRVQHLVARLQKKVEWRRRPVLLTGVLPEVQMRYRATKSPMGLTIPKGTVYVGYALWRPEGIREAEPITIGGHGFMVGKCLPESGSQDDIRIWGDLHEVQQVLGMPGRVNEIEALSCLCAGADLPTIRSDMAAELPDTQVTEFRSRAIARAETRHMVDRYAAFMMPVVLLVCALWVALLALGNVRERRGEIGILRAMGVGSGSVAALFIGKAVALGIAGAGLGFAAGTWLSVEFGPRIFPVTATQIVPVFGLLGWSLVLAPLVCVVASYVPAMLAVTQDPAEALREE